MFMSQLFNLVSQFFDNGKKSRLKGAAGESAVPPEKNTNTESCYLFASFDLCNSTKFKTLHPSNWASALDIFYRTIIDRMVTDASHEFQVWKYVGDEVLFFTELREKDSLRSIIDQIYNGLHQTIERIKESFPEAKDILSVKAVAWCALVEPYRYDEGGNAKNEKGERNRYLNYKLNLENSFTSTSYDFAGPEIDLGFRLGGHTFAKRLLISGELASLVYEEIENNKKNDCLRIVGYEGLKGIWSDRRYPIIWYEDNWDKLKIPYAYDDRFMCKHIDEIINKSPGIIKDDELTHIYDSVNRLNLIDAFKKAKASTPDGGKNERVASRFKIEIHFVAVCFTKDGKKVLVGKRKKDKLEFPGVWEFGCAQPKPREDVSDCLKRCYQIDFNIEIELCMDDGELIPLIDYNFVREGQPVFGIRFLGIVKESPFSQYRNHDDARLIDINEALALKEGENEGDCVPGFHKALRRGIDAFNRVYIDTATTPLDSA